MKKEFNISLLIYDEKKILQAIEDFSEVSKIILDNSGLCVFGEDEFEIQENFKEFMNYVLSI